MKEKIPQKRKVGLKDAIVQLVNKYPRIAVQVLQEDPGLAPEAARVVVEALIRSGRLEVTRQQAEEKPQT